MDRLIINMIQLFLEKNHMKNVNIFLSTFFGLVKVDIFGDVFFKKTPFVFIKTQDI